MKRFVRKFEFTAPNDFVVKDAVEIDRPQIVTAYLHSDNVINKTSEKRFVFEPTGTSLLAEIIAPAAVKTIVEKHSDCARQTRLG